jgi:hypothetical protein
LIIIGCWEAFVIDRQLPKDGRELELGMATPAGRLVVEDIRQLYWSAIWLKGGIFNSILL